MKLPVLRKSKSLNEQSEETSADVETPNGTARSLVEADYVSMGLSVLVVFCLIAGPAGLTVAYLSASAPPPAATSAPDPAVDLERQQAAEFATQLVVTWLGATREDASALSQLVPSAPQLRPGEEPVNVTDARAATVTAADDAWTVTVAATVAGGRRYFQVPVAIDESGVASALTLPSPIQAPPVGGAAGPNYSTTVPTNSPLRESVAAFFAAYLIADGDVSRYTSPGTDISAVEPAWFAGVEVTSLQAADDTQGLDLTAEPTDGQTVRVLASLTLIVSEAQDLNSQYALTLTSRGGRWEISSVDQAPLWAGQAPTDSAGIQPEETPPSGAAPTPSPEEE